jgi:hypothetical protein
MEATPPKTTAPDVAPSSIATSSPRDRGRLEIRTAKEVPYRMVPTALEPFAKVGSYASFR